MVISNEPTHEIMVLITSATSEGSGDASLARAFAVCTHDVWKKASVFRKTLFTFFSPLVGGVTIFSGQLVPN